MFKIGVSTVAKPPAAPVLPQNVSGVELIRRRRAMINDQHSKDKNPPPELPPKT